MKKQKKGKEPKEELELDAEEIFNAGEKKVIEEAEETEKKVTEDIKKVEGDVIKQMQGGEK